MVTRTMSVTRAVSLERARLARLVELDRTYGPDLTDAARAGLRRATFGCYCDLRALGAAADAARILAAT